ncbi:MAG TPA: type IV pilus modification protein PilV, partial [Nevskiaceae bacterium]|nr:type IV pilus modification protein PilV [Nevskiaceae bacterium]
MHRRPASKHTTRPYAPRWAQAGVGLIEVLVAALVLAVGILGIAALQTKALASSGDAMGRSMATIATYSIIDAMSLDATNAKNGSYNGTVTANACPG